MSDPTARHRAPVDPPEAVPGAPGARPIEMVRSEERLAAGVQRVPVRRARLQKFVVTERRTVEVEVRHEEVRLVYDDLGPDGVPALGEVGGLPDATRDLVLAEERVEVRTVVVPVERVRLVKDLVRSEQRVEAEVRKERIDLLEPGRADHRA